MYGGGDGGRGRLAGKGVRPRCAAAHFRRRVHPSDAAELTINPGCSLLQAEAVQTMLERRSDELNSAELRVRELQVCVVPWGGHRFGGVWV